MWKSTKEVCVGRLWGKQNKRFYQVKNQSSSKHSYDLNNSNDCKLFYWENVFAAQNLKRLNQRSTSAFLRSESDLQSQWPAENLHYIRPPTSEGWK